MAEAAEKERPQGGDFFDGQELIPPGKAPDHEPLKQAKRNAQTLTKWIAQAAAETVVVNPVVELPGWKLRIKRYGDVAVYSATSMSEHC